MALGGPILLTYFVDPLQVFRKASYNPLLSANERYQSPGLIRHYPYNAIIIGTSMSENFRPSYVDRRLGGHALKVPIRGSTAHEQFLTARLALTTDKVKRVIWGIDHWMCSGSPETVGMSKSPFPAFLYREDPFPYVQYLFNISTFIDSLKVVLTRRLWEPPDTSALERLYAWDHTVVFSRERAIQDLKMSMAQNARSLGLSPTFYGLDTMTANFAVNVLSIVDEFPHVEFVIFFPPYSILQFKYYEWQNPDLLDRLFAFRALMIRELLPRRNVILFSFDDVPAVTHNLDNYKDMAHYRVEVNEYMIDSMAIGRHRVTLEDSFGSIVRLREQTSRFDVTRILAQEPDATLALERDS